MEGWVQKAIRLLPTAVPSIRAPSESPAGKRGRAMCAASDVPSPAKRVKSASNQQENQRPSRAVGKLTTHRVSFFLRWS